MFECIGDKIKNVAKISCYLGIGVSIAYGFIMIVIMKEVAIIGVGTALIGSLISWLSCLALYGFGELLDTMFEMQESMSRIERNIYKIEKSICKEDNSAE